MAAIRVPTVSGAEPLADDAEFFERSVRPLLVEKCWSCHGPAQKIKGGLRLTSRASILKGGDSGPAAVAGDAAASLLVQATRYDQEPKMPPKGKLPEREIDVLARWVKMGLPWPESRSAATNRAEAARSRDNQSTSRFWSFDAVRAVPALGRPRFSESPNPHRPLPPRRARTQRALRRRAGRPAHPAPARDLRPDRAAADPGGNRRLPRRRVAATRSHASIDRLLASPRYGERWGRHWLDVVRYADARDLIQLPAESDFREAWRYRDWVVDAFNRDLPYTEFIRYQVAGDLLPAPSPGGINKDGLIATGMLAIADFVPGDVDKDQMIADYVNDQIDVVSKAFLGVSIACARCHDHKFDPISTEDYYALAGIFFSTRLIPGPVAGNTPLVRVPAPFTRRTENNPGPGRRRKRPPRRPRAAPARRGRPGLRRTSFAR